MFSQVIFHITIGQEVVSVILVLLYMKTNTRKMEGNVFLTTQSTHFIYGYMASDIIMVNDHTDSERKLTAATWITLFDWQQGFFYMHHPTNMITRHLLHQSRSTGWSEKYLNGSTMRDRSDDPSRHERTLLPRSYISLPIYYSNDLVGFISCS